MTCNVSSGTLNPTNSLTHLPKWFYDRAFVLNVVIDSRTVVSLMFRCSVSDEETQKLFS